ncbi:MAG: type VI secretion system tip protein VgrG [Zoogloeaceae bacterium]|jgi:type VI secretion system secreted protein VgrG|nr:type VI secretion system tip protein VgrG [Zoogloeaceae bacterium]
MSSRTLTAIGAALPGEALVAVKLQGHEGVDGLFEYRLVLKTPDDKNVSSSAGADFNLDDFIGKEVQVEIELADEDGGKREINALVVEARFLREEGRHAFYELTLKPWLYLATLTSDCKIFQDKTVEEILDALLGDYGYPVEKRLTGEYPKRDYQTQYNETDYAFFVRLCEEWGISYFFEHEGGAHRLILVDEMSAYRKNPNARYQTLKFHFPDEQVEEEYIDAFVPLRRIASGQYVSREYDYTRPKANLTVTQANPRETAENGYEVFLWHEGTSGGSHYAQPKAGPNQATNEPVTEGDRLALLRMQALRSPGWRAKGGGNARGLTPGCTFALIEHPSSAANLDYLTLETVLLVEEIAQETQKAGGSDKSSSSAATQKSGLREQTWQVRVDFEAHPLKEVYRPEPTQQKPVVPGPETALVVGPEGESLWTDELGRVKVQFYWDRLGQKNENSSCWVRVSSPWAGNQLGSLQLPRIGQEVIVSYLGGDPDLPVCTGRVHNQDNLPPWRLPGQQALSGLRSRELVQGGGNAASGQSNALVMDDTEGKIQSVLRSDHLGSELSLGYVTRVEDFEGRKDGRGEGFDLRTDGHGVVRSAAGLYLTTESRLNAQGPMKGMEESVQRLEQAKAQQQTLAEVADTFAADFGEQAKVATTLKEANEKIKGTGETDEKAGKFPELEEAHLLLSSAQGIHSTSARATHLTAGDHMALSSGEHLSLSVGKRLLASVTDGIRYFVRQAGMKFIAAADDIDVKALKDNLNLFAKLEIRQDANKIILKAKEEILLVGGGSYIRINGGTIENGTPGVWVAYAGTHLFEPPRGMSVSLPGLPKVGEGELDLFSHYTKPFGLKNTPYKVVDALGKTVEGMLDGSGKALASGLAMGPVKVFFGEDPTDTWEMDASHIGEPEWPTHELKEIADVGAFSASPFAAAAKSALDAATKVAGEIGQNLQQIGQIAPTLAPLNSLVPLGGDLGKLEGSGISSIISSLPGISGSLGNLGNPGAVASKIPGMIGIDGPVSGALSGTSNTGSVLHGIAGDIALPGALPSPSIPQSGIVDYF